MAVISKCTIMYKKRNGCMFSLRFVFLELHGENVFLTISPVITQQEPWSQPETVCCPSMPGSIYSSSLSEASFPVDPGFSKFFFCWWWCFIFIFYFPSLKGWLWLLQESVWQPYVPLTTCNKYRVSRHKLLALLKFREHYQKLARCSLHMRHFGESKHWAAAFWQMQS